MRLGALGLAALLFALPRGAGAQESPEAELPTPSEETDAADAWLEESPREGAPTEASEELPAPESPRAAEARELEEELVRDADEPAVPTNEYGLPLPSENAVRVRLVPELSGTSVRIVSRADGLKKHEGIYCDAPCTLTLEPGDYAVQVWQDGQKLHGRRLRITEDAELTVGPANRPLAWAGLGIGVAGVAAMYAALIVGEFGIGAHGEGSSADGTKKDVATGLFLGGITLASLGFPVFISKFRAQVDEEPLRGDAPRGVSRLQGAEVSSERVTGLCGGFHF